MGVILIIVTCDDDVYYEKDLLETLYSAYIKNPDVIHAKSSTIVTADCFGNIELYEKWKFVEGLNDYSAFSVFLKGVGGVLYPPNVNKKLSNDITLNEELFMNITPTADDIWFWGMAVLNDIKINAVNNYENFNYVNPERALGINGESTLHAINNGQKKNDEQIKAIVSHFPKILENVKGEIKKLAPIVLFTYNRLHHTRQTVEALKANELASESELFIFSDGAKNAQAEEKVNEVREYIRTITGFKRVEIIESDSNKGLANSVIYGVTKIVNQYGKVIVLEDDLVTSKYFLRYMNDALELYENDEEVATISGYVYPIHNLSESFFISFGESWGWATWSRAWRIFEPDGEKLLNGIRSKNLEKKFDFNDTYPYVQMLEDQINKKNNSWAIRWSASIFLKNKLCLYPQKSFVHNIGFDGGGVHCGECHQYDVQLASHYETLKKIPTVENKNCRKRLGEFYRGHDNKWKCIKKIKRGNKRIVTIMGLIKFTYTKKNKAI
ncbi:hypothetical protein FACS1894122_00740 [Alphaproteobacteria bacterium]|nr:hypothetical protein FACS1894122_00740 [Alphaproteobacteria bacterium]